MIFTIGLVLFCIGYGAYWLAKPRDVAAAILCLQGDAPWYVLWALNGGYWAAAIGMACMLTSLSLLLWNLLP